MPEDTKKAEEIAQMGFYKRRGHDRLQSTPEFLVVQARVERLVVAFAQAVSATALYSTRAPDGRQSLMFTRADDLIESAFAILTTAHAGMLRVARREQRYLLEATVKYLVTDQATQGWTVEKRIGYFEREIQYSSLSKATGLHTHLLSEQVGRELREQCRLEYSRLSGVVHAYVTGVRQRIQAAARGEHLGFESIAEVEAFADELESILDVCLALVLHALAPGLARDMFTLVFDEQDDWPYRNTKFVSGISEPFGHKVEREPLGSDENT